MTDRAMNATNRPHPLVQAIRAALGSRAMTQTTTAAAGLALLLAVPIAASAADFTVVNRNDSGPGSLRQAVLDANATPGPDTIRFDSRVTGTIALTSGALIVTDPLTLEGPGRDLLTLDGSAVPTIIQVEDDLSIAHLKLANAAGDAIKQAKWEWVSQLILVDSIIQGSTAAALNTPKVIDTYIASSIITGNGEGVWVDGSYLTISDSTITDNGGTGIRMFGPGLTIENSTISGNGSDGIVAVGAQPRIRHTTISGNKGDGARLVVYYYHGGSLTAEDSVISGNGGDGVDGRHAYIARCTIGNNHGSGIAGYASISDSTIKENGEGGLRGGGNISNCTITNNRSPFDGAGISGDSRIENSTIIGNISEGSGGGFRAFSSTSVISNSIISGNRAAADPDLSGYFKVEYSLIQDRGQSVINETVSGSNIIGQDPLLGPLADNGGPTETHALRRGSPAIDRGDPDFTPPPDFDQRGPGFDRLVNGRIDMGAVEGPVINVWLQSPGDINGDGRPEIAIVTGVGGRNLATVKDAANGALISQFEFSAALHPFAVETIAAAGQYQTPHLVLLGSTPAQAETRNALTGTLLGTVTFDAGATPVDLTVLPDQDGNGIQDLAMLATGTTKISAADGVTERIVYADWLTYGPDDYSPSISADGRFVAFLSSVNNLVPGDTNATVDVFVRDRAAGTTERVSLGANGTQGNSSSLDAAISADGRYVAFGSDASNLVPGDTHGSDIFVHDRAAGTTERVSLGANGTQGNRSS
jgi:hypothetical protein